MNHRAKNQNMWSLLSSAVSVLESHEDAFERVYRMRAWGGDGSNSSLSGQNAHSHETVLFCTQAIAASKRVLAARAAVGAQRSSADDSSRDSVSCSLGIVDAPMGDWFWMPSCLERISRSLPAGPRLNDRASTD